MISRPGESGLAGSLRRVAQFRQAVHAPVEDDEQLMRERPRPLRRFDGCSDTGAQGRLRRAAPRRETRHRPFRRGAAEPIGCGLGAAAAGAPAPGSLRDARQLRDRTIANPAQTTQAVVAAICALLWSITRSRTLRTVCRAIAAASRALHVRIAVRAPGIPEPVRHAGRRSGGRTRIARAAQTVEPTTLYLPIAPRTAAWQCRLQEPAAVER